MVKRIFRKLRLRGRRAQSLAEYSLLLAVVTAAVVSVQFFIKPKTQGIIHATISQFGDPNFLRESELSSYSIEPRNELSSSGTHIGGEDGTVHITGSSKQSSAGETVTEEVVD